MIIIYTDGACSGNPGPGGWAAIIKDQDTERILSGGETHTTNNRMELLAVLKGLQGVETQAEIKIYTDSRYVQLGMTEWLIKWQQNNWKNANKKPVKNKDLWIQLVSECERHEAVHWLWVRAHHRSLNNIRADTLAREAIARYQ